MPVPFSKNIVISLVTGLMFGLSVTLFTFHLTCSTNTLSPHSQRSPSYEQNTSVNKDEDLEASEMTEQVRVLCWIMTQPQNHKIKVKKIWKYDKLHATHVYHKTHDLNNS